MTALADRIAALLGCASVTLTAMTGGDLSAVYGIVTDDGRDLVAKQGGDAGVEARMLTAIAESGAPAPEIVAEDGDLLVITRCRSGGRSAGAWSDLATVLNILHASTSEAYGWSDDHAFGQVTIANEASDDWAAFWAEHRLTCHLPHIASELGRRVEALADGIADHLTSDPPPALLHGDLWGGNILFDGDRVSALIDPACYYGDREVDVAMLTLFDRPPREFVARLNLPPGWEARQPVYRLWPLLVHLRLFGGGYGEQVDAELRALGF